MADTPADRDALATKITAARALLLALTGHAALSGCEATADHLRTAAGSLAVAETATRPPVDREAVEQPVPFRVQPYWEAT